MEMLEYLSITHLAQKYDLHPDTIKRKDLVEGFHYIKIGTTIRYHIKNMHELLVNHDSHINSDLDRYLVDYDKIEVHKVVVRKDK